MALNVTTAVIGSGCNTATATPSLAQWDVGQVLKIEGVDLPAAYQVDFSTEYTRNAIQKIGNAGGVAIPNELLQRSAPITAYIVLHEGEDDRETEYWITIHITPRTPPETVTPDPEEQSVIDETIAALQDGVAAAEAAAESVQNMGVEAETLTPGSPLTVTKYVDPETGAVTLTFGLTQGPKGDNGYSPTITITEITGGHRFTVTDAIHPSGQSFDVMDGTKGDQGDDGYSPVITITTITGGHRFTVTDKTHPSGQSFDVLDGAKGDQGDDGYSPVVTITTITGGHRVTITDKTHPSGQTFDVMDGVIQSVNGKSAASITLDSGDIEFDDSETYPDGSVGKELSNQKNAIGQLQDGVLSATAKAALLNCFAHVAWADANGQTYYDALESAISTPSELVSISAVYTQTDPIYTIDSLNELKPSLVVTATYSDSTTETVTDYTLSGTLTEGTSIITVSYSGKTTTFNVTVTGVATGYTFYDYITRTESIDAVMGSGSGILTDIGFSTEQTFELKFRYTESTRSASNPILGIREGQSGTKEFGLFYVPSIKKVGYWYDGTDTANSITDVLDPDTIYTIKVQPVGVSQTYPSYATININGTDYSTGSTGTGVTFDSWLGFFKYGISATATSGNPDYFAGQQIGRAVIRNSNTEIVHDIRPAYNGSFYGLYDLVGEKFYYYNIASMYTCNNWQ